MLLFLYEKSSLLGTHWNAGRTERAQAPSFPGSDGDDLWSLGLMPEEARLSGIGVGAEFGPQKVQGKLSVSSISLANHQIALLLTWPANVGATRDLPWTFGSAPPNGESDMLVGVPDGGSTAKSLGTSCVAWDELKIVFVGTTSGRRSVAEQVSLKDFGCSDQAEVKASLPDWATRENFRIEFSGRARDQEGRVWEVSAKSGIVFATLASFAAGCFLTQFWMVRRCGGQTSFITYVHGTETDEIMRQIFERLCYSGRRSLFDKNALRDGAPIHPFMECAGTADYLVILLSPAYVERLDPMFEAYLFLSQIGWNNEKIFKKVSIYHAPGVAEMPLFDRDKAVQLRFEQSVADDFHARAQKLRDRLSMFPSGARGLEDMRRSLRQLELVAAHSREILSVFREFAPVRQFQNV